MAKSKKQTTVEIPAAVVTTPEFIGAMAIARKAIEFGYTDKQGVTSRRVAVPIRFEGTKAVMASLLTQKDEIYMQGAIRNFEVARITAPKIYVPTEQEKPVALLGWTRVKSLFAALDAAKHVSEAAKSKRETRAAELMQAAFEANRAMRAQIEAEIRN